jgi:hypothetical protein
MVVNRAEDPSRLNRPDPHPKLPSRHALDLGAKIQGCQHLGCHFLVSGACPFPI